MQQPTAIEADLEYPEIDTKQAGERKELTANDYYIPGEFKISLQADKKEAIYRLSKYLLEKHHIKTIKGSKREIFVYQDGVYVPGEEIIRKDIRELLEELSTTNNNKEIIETVKDLSPIDRDKFTADKHLLNLNNGVLDVRTLELREHHPDYLFLTKIPINFDPQAECPTIKKFLSDVLDDEQELLIQEWLGYGLYPEYFIKKAIIFVGEGDTGKTTLMNLMFMFFGERNVSGVSLQKISSDKFACAHMYTKYVNLYDDLSFKDISDNGAFKIATGGGVITGEMKFGNQFQFKNYAKLTFACNKIPDVKDADDDAYFNRWIVIQFNYAVDEKDRDKQLIHKMTTPEELSGLLNFALVGLTRLLKKEKFSYNKGPEEIKAEMLRSGSSIANFAFDCLEPSDGVWISKVNMYNAYIQFTRAQNLANKNIQALGHRLPKYAPYISDEKPVDPLTGKQVTAWSNVRFKSNFASSLPRENSECVGEWGDES
ncbi:MAG: phage/plasmid primase, P4 family [Patescibacteria group bacterium]